MSTLSIELYNVDRDKFTFALNIYIKALDPGCLDCCRSCSSVLLLWLFQKTRVSTDTCVHAAVSATNPLRSSPQNTCQVATTAATLSNNKLPSSLAKPSMQASRGGLPCKDCHVARSKVLTRSLTGISVFWELSICQPI